MANRDETLNDLLLAIQNNDRDALAALYHETSASVYAFALSILKNPHDAEDVLQDCFIQIFQNARQYHPAGKPMAWIMTIAKNLCFMQLRKQSKMEALPQQWDTMIPWNEEAAAIDRIVLQQCMSRLTDQQRQIVVLHAVAGMKHREIAVLMNLALPTVLSKYHRAIQKLKSNI